MGKLAKALTASAGNAGSDPLYVENVFSTFLYTGTASSIVVNNGLDLSGEGGLTWLKSRSLSEANILMDTVQGLPKALVSNNTNDVFSLTDGITAFNSNGFTLGTSNIINTNASTNVSWSFRKAEKFFDIVKWTGSNNSATDIGKGIVSHNLGVAPALVIVKNTTQNSTNWIVYHKDQSTGYYSLLNSTAAQTNSGSVAYFSKYDGGWAQTNPDANNIYVGYNYQTNGNTDTMVAYLFGDAAAFGDDGDESIVKCGSYTGNGSTPGVAVNIGFEPQWLLVKPSTTTGPWSIIDNMRGWNADSSGDKWFEINTSGAEYTSVMMDLTSTGFKTQGNYSSTNSNGQTYIYMAIRRPMKTPEAGTEVFNPQGYTGNGSTRVFNLPLTPDMAINIARTIAGDARAVNDRLRGSAKELYTTGTGAEAATGSAGMQFDYSNQIEAQSYRISNTETYINYHFKRATGFMDVVAGKSDASGNVWNGTHNLGVNIEFAIVKNRQSGSTQWWTADLNAGKLLKLNQNDSGASLGTDFTTTTTAFKAFDGYLENNENFVLYAFATLAGVSKVGTYTGNAGYAVNVDCGFSNNARFILIKRTNSTGDWYVWDSARGIVAGNDPYSLLNTTAAEVTNTDYIDPLSSGFTVTSSAPAALNASGGSYLFLAIA